MITFENHEGTQEPTDVIQYATGIGTRSERLKFYAEKAHQVEADRLAREKENLELRQCLSQLKTQLNAREKELSTVSKIQIEGPAPVVPPFYRLE